MNRENAHALNCFSAACSLFSKVLLLLLLIWNGRPQGCFDQRMRAWQRWQEAQSTLQKKREAEAKLLWANKPEKLQQAKEEITEVTDTGTTELLQLSNF